jgi:hypothetical protein
MEIKFLYLKKKVLQVQKYEKKYFSEVKNRKKKIIEFISNV